MARKLRQTALQILTAREVHKAREGDHSDGGGLVLRATGIGANWVLRYTAPSGRRREMGLGVADRSSVAAAGDSLTGARAAAHRAREQLRQGIDPLQAKAAQREAERQADVECRTERSRERWTLARCARDYHERVIEPTRSSKHGAQWIASLENHVPAALWHAPIQSIDAPALLAALLAIRPHQRARNLSQGERVHETVQRVRRIRLANPS